MEKRCSGCMRIKKASAPCAFCGWLETDQNAYHQLPTGTVLHSQYQIGRCLGQGGFGITYLGWDTKLETPVAIKEYYPSAQVSRSQGTEVTVVTNAQAYQEGKDRFLQEARTLAKLRRQYNIVQIHNFFSENNTAYIVMECIEGLTLKEHVRQCGGSLSVADTFAIMQPIFHVMEQVHHNGMIHRDISPDNIMIQNDGTVKILDFGTARDVDMNAGQLTHSTQAVLKRGFAPPEQYLDGRDIDQRADEYALCCTIYYCLTGKRPMDAMNRLMDRAPIPWSAIPGLTKAQAAALETGTALRPENRFPDLLALEAALFGTAPAPVPEPKPRHRPAVQEEEKTELVGRKSRPRKKNGTRLALLFILLLLAAGLGFYFSQPYNRAQAALLLGYYDAAYTALSSMEESPEQQALLTEVRYQEALSFQDAQSYHQAYQAFEALGGYQDSRDRAAAIADTLMQPNSIAAGTYYTVGLRSNGTVVLAGKEWLNQQSTAKWDNIVATAAGRYHTVGLKADGTVVAAGDGTYGRCNVSQWQGIVSIAAGWRHTIGLRADGTVVAVGSNEVEQSNVAQWKDITAVATGNLHTVGLKADGTVVATGDNQFGQCQVSEWTDIVAVAAGGYHTAGLKADGTVVAVGRSQYDMSGWTDIVALAVGSNHAAGLKADGTVVAAGHNWGGQSDVSDWTDMVQIAVGGSHTVGLKADGTVLAVGYNEEQQCQVSGWTDIRVPGR